MGSLTDLHRDLFGKLKSCHWCSRSELPFSCVPKTLFFVWLPKIAAIRFAPPPAFTYPTFMSAGCANMAVVKCVMLPIKVASFMPPGFAFQCST